MNLFVCELSIFFIRAELINDTWIPLVFLNIQNPSENPTCAYRVDFWMHPVCVATLISSKYLLKNDLFTKNTTWDKVSADIKKEFDSEPVYNRELLKTKIKSHGDEVTDFHDKKFLKVGFNHTSLVVISLDSALKKDENYYPQVFLKECKYIEKKVARHINDNLSDFSYSDYSDEEYIKAIWINAEIGYQMKA